MSEPLVAPSNKDGRLQAASHSPVESSMIILIDMAHAPDRHQLIRESGIYDENIQQACRFSSFLSLGIALTCADADRLIDLSSGFSHRSVIFLGDRRGRPPWPAAVIGLEPAAVTESRR